MHSAQKGDLVRSVAPDTAMLPVVQHMKVPSLSFLPRIRNAHKVCQKQMKSWQSLGRVEVYMNHIFICEKFEEEHDARLKHVRKGMWLAGLN